MWDNFSRPKRAAWIPQCTKLKGKPEFVVRPTAPVNIFKIIVCQCVVLQ